VELSDAGHWWDVTKVKGTERCRSLPGWEKGDVGLSDDGYWQVVRKVMRASAMQVTGR